MGDAISFAELNNLLSTVWPGWEAVEQIGQGAFSAVYKVKRNTFGGGERFSALKVVRVPSDEDEKQFKFGSVDSGSSREYYRSIVANVVNEIELLSKLRGNTNLVSYEDHSVIEHSENKWTILIRMELLTPLSDYIASRQLSEEEVVKIGTDICSALEVCEKNNILHRDIKLENVFVNDSGDFVLGDFGTAKTVDKTLDASTMAGTYPYMAPEVIAQELYGRQADIYSLGILMYKLLNNGRFPFYPPYPENVLHSDVEEAFRKRCTGEKMPAPCNAGGNLSKAVLKACAHNPGDRFKNASEMKSALETLNRSENVEKSKLRKPGTLRKAGICATAVLIAVSALFAVLHIINRNKSETESIEGAASFISDGFVCVQREDGIEIAGLSEPDTEIKIPKKIKGKKVVALGKKAFYYCHIDEIKLPKTLVSVGDGAFYGVSGLTSLEIPSGVKKIGKSAFAEMFDLTEISLPASLESINEFAFYSSKKLEKINISTANDKYKSVDGILFDKAGKELIAVPCNIDLSDYSMPETVEKIDKIAFAHNFKIKTVSIPSSVKIIGDYAFDSCRALESVDFCEGLEKIENGGFANCQLLEEADLPESCKSIGKAAFMSDYSLETVSISKSANDIGVSAFWGTAWLEKQKGFVIVGDGLLIALFDDSDSIEEKIVVPDGVKQVICMTHYYYECDEDGNTTSVRGMEFNAKSVSFPDSVIKIGSTAFDIMGHAPESWTLPAGLAELEPGLLDANTLSSNSFNNADIHLDPANQNFVMDENGVLFNADKTALVRYPFANKSAAYTIPDSVTEIYENAFQGCNNLQKIVIPDSVTEIKAETFSYCESLSEVSLPGNLTSIGENAFNQCSSLSSIVFPDSLVSIGEGAFSYSALSGEIALGSKLSEIGAGAFVGCESISSYIIDEANTCFCSDNGVVYSKDYSELLLYPCAKEDVEYSAPAGLISVGDYAFRGNNNITHIQFPETVMEIGSYSFCSCGKLTDFEAPGVRLVGSRAFDGCYELSAITLSDAYVMIEDGTFARCKELSYSSFGNYITYIGSSAFYGCESLCLNNQLYPGDYVRYIGSSAFDDSDITSVMLRGNEILDGNPFSGCEQLKEITLSGLIDNPLYCAVDGVLYTADQTALLCYPDGKTDDEYTLPATVTAIEKDAFSFNCPIKVLHIKNKECDYSSSSFRVVYD